jgi:hypothetical protein
LGEFYQGVLWVVRKFRKSPFLCFITLFALDYVALPRKDVKRPNKTLNIPEAIKPKLTFKPSTADYVIWLDAC